MKSRWSSFWNSFCLCLLDWDVLTHLQSQLVPYLHVIILYGSVTTVSNITVYNSNFTKLGMWLQMQHFQVVGRGSWHITGECRTPHWALPVSFWHLAHTLASTCCRSPACFQICFPPLQLITSLPCLSYLYHFCRLVREIKEIFLLAEENSCVPPNLATFFPSYDEYDTWFCNFKSTWENTDLLCLLSPSKCHL